jgi:hypothetical protein
MMFYGRQKPPPGKFQYLNGNPPQCLSVYILLEAVCSKPWVVGEVLPEQVEGLLQLVSGDEFSDERDKGFGMRLHEGQGFIQSCCSSFPKLYNSDAER